MGYDIFPGAIHIDHVGTCTLPAGSQSRNHSPDFIAISDADGFGTSTRHPYLHPEW